MPDKDVYVLTSSRTFSGAEEFAYDLQALKRATIIGETTRGGANFGNGFVLGEHFVSFIPVGRAVNPATKTNWDGVGVRPDVPIEAEKALDTAYVMALEKARVNANDPQIKDVIDTALTDTKKRLNAEGK
jgi:retinol-binding protein 3